MTRKGHHLDLLENPKPIRKAATTSPWAGYLRCDECGVDAGKACRDMDDLPALEVCEGRRLFLGDSVDMTRRPKTEDAPRVFKTPEEKRAKAREYAKQRRFRERKQAKTAPCACCGATVRITAKATYVEQVYCRATECRKAYRRAYEARRHRTRAKPKAPCCYCGAERMRGPSSLPFPACADAACKRRAKADNQRVARAAKHTQRTSTCVHCGVVFPCIMPTARYCTPTCRYHAKQVTPSTDTL